MKKQFLIVSVILITVGLVLTTNATSIAQSNDQFTVPLTDPTKRGNLKAHLNLGSITVKGTARKDILVKYTSDENEDKAGDDDDQEKVNENISENKNNNRDNSREGLKRIGGGGMDLEVTETNNQVKVQSNSWSHKINLEIEIPSTMDLEVHTYNGGDVMVTNVQGELALSNYNGEITALNISGSVVASTYNGEIKVTFDKITEGAPMSYSTYNGDIDLTFPASLKATLKMKTERGEIYTGFDVNVTSKGPEQKKDTRSGVYKVVIDDWKRAEVNGGGPDFTMKNYNGDIMIRKK